MRLRRRTSAVRLRLTGQTLLVFWERLCLDEYWTEAEPQISEMIDTVRQSLTALVRRQSRTAVESAASRLAGSATAHRGRHSRLRVQHVGPHEGLPALSPLLQY
jgi:hypothetical protein